MHARTHAQNAIWSNQRVGEFYREGDIILWVYWVVSNRFISSKWLPDLITPGNFDDLNVFFPLKRGFFWRLGNIWGTHTREGRWGSILISENSTVPFVRCEAMPRRRVVVPVVIGAVTDPHPLLWMKTVAHLNFEVWVRLPHLPLVSTAD